MLRGILTLFSMQCSVSLQQYSSDLDLAVASPLLPTFVGRRTFPVTRFAGNGSTRLRSNLTDFHTSAPMCLVDQWWSLVGSPSVSKMEPAYRSVLGCGLDRLTECTWSSIEDLCTSVCMGLGVTCSFCLIAWVMKIPPPPIDCHNLIELKGKRSCSKL